MKVMHILGSLGPGGAEMGIVRLIRYFPKGKIKHAVCSIGSDVTMKDQLPQGTNCYALGLDGPSYIAFIKLYKLLKKTNIDIAHVNNLAPWLDVALASRLAGCNCVETFHGIEENHYTFSLPRRLLLRIACLLTFSITAVGEPVAQRLAHLTGIKRSRIQVLPNGVDTDLFKPCSSHRYRRHLKLSLGVPENSFLFGCVASLTPVKNHADLLKAFAMALYNNKNSDSIKDVYLILVGNGPLEPELKVRAAQLGIERRVIFLGRRNDVQKILQALDLFILNSKTEGMSYAILEAMATGVPVIATNVGANTDLVERNAEGYLVPQGEIMPMVNRITEVLKDKSILLNMGNKARKKIVERYSHKSMVFSYERLYARIVGEGKPP